MPSPIVTAATSEQVVVTDPPEAFGLSGNCQSVVTNEEGKAVLNNLQPGAYVVTEHVPNGFVPTTATSQDVTVTVNNTATVSFGNRPEVCVTPSPGSSPTPTPEICVSPSPSVSPTPGKTVTPPIENKGPSAPPAENLPKTGAAEAAMLSLFALVTSLYLYLRERRALTAAKSSYKLKR
jgi:uncharacterized surface anchored protein